ncbi:MAG: hybrid sensor histidine kinase/response regulator [Planctomycetales bacterium]|nr:hybrid sensor histidine kinase/response regulator [Planctomycetales bacterium]
MDDRLRYLSIFREEAKEHLSSLTAGLLHLEENPDDVEGLRELLRNAHTIKGSARLIGLAQIGEVAHRMEDVLRALEDRRLPVAVELVDLLLEATDAIRSWVEGSSEGEEIVQAQAGDLANRLAVAAAAVTEGEALPSMTAGAAGGQKSAPGGRDLGSALSGLLDDSGSDTDRRPAPGARPPEPAPAAEPAPSVSPGAPSPPPPRHGRGTTAVGVEGSRDTIRVDVGNLDRLTDLVGELVIQKSRIENRTFSIRELFARLQETAAAGRTPRPAPERLREIEAVLAREGKEFAEDFSNDVVELGLLSADIQASAFDLRMLPVGTIFEPYRRTVRDLKRQLAKEVSLEIQGAETKLDKRLLEEVNPALLHLVRNSMDHGIESPADREKAGKPREGRIELRAYAKGSNVLIEVQDDGRGLDPREIRATAVARRLVAPDEAARLSDHDILYLIFRHGFTTSRIITDVSGRGLGMSVVWGTVHDLKGDVSVESVPGRFTRFTMTLPLTFSSMVALLVDCRSEIVAVPASFVLATLRVARTELAAEGGATVLSALDTVFPVVDLHRFLGFRTGRNGHEPSAKVTVVVVRFRGETLGLLVDRVLRFQEIVVKSLGPFLRTLPFAAGVTILRKGDPAVILNVFDLFQHARAGIAAAQPDAAPPEQPRRRVLVVDDSLTTRTIERSILESHGYAVDVATSGEEALRLLRDQAYDLLVTDIEMPGISGFDLTRRVREDPRHKAVPVVIVTSLARDADRMRGVEVGAQAYIVKGTFRQDVLLDTVRSLIG